MNAADFQIKQGDTSPALEATLLDQDDAAVDLSEATVRFIMTPASGGSPVVAAPASNDQVDEATKGMVSYAWQDAGTGTVGDTDVAGVYHGEFEVTFDNGSVETFPNGRHLVILITSDLD